MAVVSRTSARVRPTIIGQIPGRSVPIYINDSLLDRLSAILSTINSSRICEIVTDATVDAFYGKAASTALRRGGWKVHTTQLAPGESIKSSRTITALHDAWFARGYDRHTIIIALGGGTVGDAAGYAAATFLRGCPLWQIPTSIIGQVDAAIGGKVGINHKRGKNLIGAFYQPSGIVVDVSLLASLPQRERRSGLAEVVKYGVISDEQLFRQCEKLIGDWVSGEALLPISVIRKCIQIKTDVVEADEADRGLRHTLNFGHTIGHGLERWGGYRRLRHGEAVAYGMVAAGWIAKCRGMMSNDDFDRLEDVCSYLYPRRGLSNFNLSDVVQHLKMDKKRVAGRIRWILPHAIGTVAMYDDIAAAEINGALRYVRGHSRR